MKPFSYQLLLSNRIWFCEIPCTDLSNPEVWKLCLTLFKKLNHKDFPKISRQARDAFIRGAYITDALFFYQHHFRISFQSGGPFQERKLWINTRDFCDYPECWGAEGYWNTLQKNLNEIIAHCVP